MCTNPDATETYDFEFHVTVKAPASSIDEFRLACENACVKPLLIEGQDRDGRAVLLDLMTSSRLQCTTEESVAELQRLVAALNSYGFEVVRQKVETIPWHHDATEVVSGQYFESHIAVSLDESLLPSLRDALLYGVHISKNAFRRVGETVVMMATIRSYAGDLSSFKRTVEHAVQQLAAFGRDQRNFMVAKPLIEFVHYDSNIHHDDKWLLYSAKDSN